MKTTDISDISNTSLQTRHQLLIQQMAEAASRDPRLKDLAEICSDILLGGKSFQHLQISQSDYVKMLKFPEICVEICRIDDHFKQELNSLLKFEKKEYNKIISQKEHTLRFKKNIKRRKVELSILIVLFLGASGYEFVKFYLLDGDPLFYFGLVLSLTVFTILKLTRYKYFTLTLKETLKLDYIYAQMKYSEASIAALKKNIRAAEQILGRI